MPKNRITFSGDHLDLIEIATFYGDTEKGLQLFHTLGQPFFAPRFSSMTPTEVMRNFEERILELDRVASMSILAAVEAAFRIDYLHRVYERPRDDISRAMRALYQAVENKASLEDQILNIWRDNSTGAARIISDLKGALKYRHWLAHGRYWEAKMGREKYDFQTIYQLADTVFASFPLLAPDD